MIDLQTAAFALALFVHAGALLWWGGKISKTVSVLERLLQDHEQRLRGLERAG